MSLREQLQSNPIAAGIVIAVLLGLAAMFATRSSNSAPVEQRWYYDMQTGDLFAHPESDRPPIEGPSGGEAVWAYVFSCGACNESERFVAYLATYGEPPPDPYAPDIASVPEKEQLVASVPENGDEPQWVVPESSAGEQVTTRFRTKCPQSLVQCQPE